MQVLELHGSPGLGQDRKRVRVPFRQNMSERHGLAVFHPQTRAVHHVIALLLAALLVHHGNQPRTVHRNQYPASAAHRLQVDKLHETDVFGLQLRLLGHSCCRSANVERAHGELRPRLANRLRSDHAGGLAELHHAPGRQVAPVAPHANSPPRFTGQHGADFHSLNPRRLDRVGKLLGDLLVDVNDHVPFVVLNLVQ